MQVKQKLENKVVCGACRDNIDTLFINTMCNDVVAYTAVTYRSLALQSQIMVGVRKYCPYTDMCVPLHRIKMNRVF